MEQLPHADASALTLTVVIPVWNGISHLAKCLEAIEASTRKPDEIVVVDSNSTDRTVELARHHTGNIFNREFRRNAVRISGVASLISMGPRHLGSGR